MDAHNVVHRGRSVATQRWVFGLTVTEFLLRGQRRARASRVDITRFDAFRPELFAVESRLLPNIGQMRLQYLRSCKERNCSSGMRSISGLKLEPSAGTARFVAGAV